MRRLLFSLAGLAAVVWLATTMRVVHVRAASMAPTLRDGDRVIVQRASFASRWRTWRASGLRGAIVVLDAPNGDAIVKRIVAVAGDRVRASSAHVVVNGLDTLGATAPDRAALREFIVPRGHVFVVGDNPSASRDSRHWGPVEESRIRAFVLMRWSLR